MTETPEVNIPKYFNIGQACTRPTAENHDDAKPAIIVDDAARGVQTLSYYELNLLTDKFANTLNALNLKKGHRLLLWLPNCAEFPIAFFGALKLGVIAVPASMLLTGGELDFLAIDSQANTIVTTPELWQQVNELDNAQHEITSIIFVDHGDTGAENLPHEIETYEFEQLLEASSATALAIETEAEDPAYLVYTSGTTGYPKGVLHAHRSLLGRLPSSSHWFHYKNGDDRILHTGKFNWTYVLGTALMDPLFQGKTVVVSEGDGNVRRWPELISKHQCSIFIAVPTVYRQLLQKTDYGEQDVPSLRHCMCAGEHLSDEVLEEWAKRFKQNIYEALGMSECSYYLSQHVGMPIKGGSAGFIQPGHKIEILNAEMEAVEPNEEGMLCIREDDPGLFLGYWQNDEETKQAYKAGYFCTGDFAKLDDDGYVWFLGRKDDIINSFGYRLSPLEIERVIKTNPHVLDCVVLEEQIAPEKNIVTACIILSPDNNVTEQDIVDYASLRLASYKVPKRIVFTQEFPRTNNGKVLRTALKAALLGNSS